MPGYDLNTLLANDAEMKAYFDSLPAFVQENIHMTGPSITNLQQLKDCAEGLMKSQG